MCWITYNNAPEMKIASEDIPVKKVLTKRDYYHSIFFPSFTWKPNCEYKTQLEKPLYDGVSGYSIIKGFHSCASVKEIFSNYSRYLKNDGHFITKAQITDVICQFVIPKGSQYYVNEWKEYVSDRLKFIGEIKK